MLKKKNKNFNVIIRYSSMSGIKLTVLLPLLNQLLRDVIATPAESQYVLILCHSAIRCSEFEGFLKELFTFCADVIDIVDIYSGDKVENALRLKQATAAPSDADDLKASIKARCKVLLSTPTQFLDLVTSKKVPAQLLCSSLFVDKVDMHIALDLSSELVKIAETVKLEPKFKTIITSQFKGASENDQEQVIKKAFMGEKKALIIQINEDNRVKSKCKTHIIIIMFS